MIKLGDDLTPSKLQTISLIRSLPIVPMHTSLEGNLFAHDIQFWWHIFLKSCIDWMKILQDLNFKQIFYYCRLQATRCQVLKVEYLIICIICDTDLVNKLILQVYTLHKYK